MSDPIDQAICQAIRDEIDAFATKLAKRNIRLGESLENALVDLLCERLAVRGN